MFHSTRELPYKGVTMTESTKALGASQTFFCFLPPISVSHISSPILSITLLHLSIPYHGWSTCGWHTCCSTLTNSLRQFVLHSSSHQAHMPFRNSHTRLYIPLNPQLFFVMPLSCTVAHLHHLYFRLLPHSISTDHFCYVNKGTIILLLWIIFILRLT